ncbi:hypothetical protein Tco_0160599 [Tanacetum coccineum]
MTMLILRGRIVQSGKRHLSMKSHVTGESFGQINEKEQGQSSLRNQEQTDDYDFWTESYASDDDEVPDYVEIGLLWSLSVFIRSSVIWERVHNFQLRIESYQQKVNLTALTISFLGIEKNKMFSIIYERVHGIIYKNSKKEKRVMRHSKIHKFCDATLAKQSIRRIKELQ